MGKHCCHCTRAAGAMLLGVAAICAASGGCWQEIEYTGPDPSTIARRDRPRTSESKPAEIPEPAQNDASPTLERETPPYVEPEPPADATEATRDVPERTDPAAEELTSNGLPFDDIEPQLDEAEPELFPLDDAEPHAGPAAGLTVSELPSDPPIATRLAAWQLGSKLTLAALAHDRGLTPADVDAWFIGARAAAEQLGTSIAELPEPAAPNEGDRGSPRVHEYLFEQGSQIWRDLSARYGADHAALFEVAVRSNVLLVLYAPGSPHVDPLATSIRGAAPQAELPPELWQPLLDKLAGQAPIADVRLTVRGMHADVEKFLSERAEQE